MSVDILDRVYDAYTGEMGQQFMRETQRRIHWICAAARGDAVLDVGCSQGIVPVLLGREGKRVVGVDSNPAAIQEAERHLVSEPLSVRKRVTFIEADALSHDFAGEHFESVLMGEVLEHLLEPGKLVQQAARLLEPGGRLVITVPFGINDHIDHKHTFYLLEPFRLLSQHFDIVEVTLLGKWLGLVGARRAPSAELPAPSWSSAQIAQLEQAFQAVERTLVDEVAVLRSKLDDANTKYRASGEELARLKREAAHHETERKAVERTLQQLEQRQADARAPGDQEQQLLALRDALQAERDASHGRDVSVARLEERLSHASQMRELELSVRNSEIARLQRERGELAEKVEALSERTLRGEQLALQREGELKLLSHERVTLQADRDAQRARAEASAERGQRLETQASERESSHGAQRAEWQATLDGKARQLSEAALRRAELEQAVALAQAAAAGLEQQLSAAGERWQQSQAEAASYRAQLVDATALLAERQLQLREEQVTVHERDAQLADSRAQLAERDAELAERDTQLADSRAQLAERDAEFAERTMQLAERDTQLAERDMQLAERDTQLAERDVQLAERTTQLAEFETRLSERDAELAERDAQLIECRADLAERETRLAQHDARLRERDAQLAERTMQLAERDTQLVERTAQLTERDARLANSRVVDETSVRERLTRERGEELELAQRQRKLLERELENQRATLRDLERKADQARQQLLSATQGERRAIQRLEQERRGKESAERQVIKTRDTLSFQLGYRLIHGFKSPAQLRALPGSLWALNKEAERRRADRALREGQPTPKPPHRPPAFTPQPAPTTRAPHAPLPTRAEPTVPLAPPATSATTSPPRPAAGSDLRPATERASVTTQRRLPQPSLEAGLGQLRVACVHDEFTFASFAPECQLRQLTPAGFREELASFDPELLFVESAWRGEGELWGKKVSHRGRELVEIVEWCRAQGVPTVFWNKEDPVHFQTFLNTAKLFDHVFTTDLDCVDRYRYALGHDRVHLLPFACQPALHNPLERYTRKDAICFAGAYYARYPERQQDLASFANSFVDAPRLEIFDRNHGKDDPNYAFPAEYQPFIVGTLAFDEIDRAYKGYRYALNLNSIKESQTMFARRVFELLASNTSTVSNFSRGVRLLFGDLVLTTDSGARALEGLRQLAMDEPRTRRLRLAALRKVLQEHTYGERLRFIASKVWGMKLAAPLPKITVLAQVKDAAAAAAVSSSFERQAYANKHLVVVAPAHVAVNLKLPSDAVCIELEGATRLTIAQAAPDANHVASFHDRDFYGPHFLSDLALGLSYSKAIALGKVAAYAVSPGGAPRLEHDGAQYRATPRLPCRAALIQKRVIAGESLLEWLTSLDTRQLEAPQCVALDEFNYCREGAAVPLPQLGEVLDLANLDVGLSLDELTGRGAAVRHADQQAPARRQISAERLAAVLKPGLGKAFSVALQDGSLVVQSQLGDETHEYLYANQHFKPEELGLPQSGKFRLEASPGLNLHAAFLFLDDKKQRIGNKVSPAARNETLSLPPGTAFVQLGLRIYGSGSSSISGLMLDHVEETPASVFGRSDYLLVTNHYPAENDLYRNAFVHRRVADYRRQGTRVDVFRHRAGEKLGYREFEGVDVISGGGEALAALLRSNTYKAVLVHFLDPAMWQVLREHGAQAKPLIWLHGAEVQAWHRRSFNYKTDAERDTARRKSEARDDFWRQVLDELPASGKLIFVSQHFAEQTLSDLGLPKAHRHCTVIHNLIDGELFKFRPKSTEQRKRILSIRPYVSRKYANDLTVAAILELSQRADFDQLFFHLIGDGPLFEETVAPLRGFPNVRLDKGFLTQQQIADLHRDYGVFLCPTRDDTQGVSRDEAMASGLVPITNRVSAIPEFVDDACCMLAAPESSHELAAAIATLLADPELFSRLSERAARRVRQQSSAERTTEQELALMLASSQPSVGLRHV